MIVDSNDMMTLFARISGAFRIRADKLYASKGLSSGQVAILESLFRSDGATQSEIARELQVSGATVNKLLRTMIDRGHVTTAKCPFDSRVTRVYATASARALGTAIAVCRERLDAEFFGSLTDVERMMFAQLLAKSGPDGGSLPNGHQK